MASAATAVAGVVRRYLINPFRRQQLLLCLIKLVFLVDFRLLTQTMAVALLLFIISTIVPIRIIANAQHAPENSGKRENFQQSVPETNFLNHEQTRAWRWRSFRISFLVRQPRIHVQLLIIVDWP